MNKKLLDKLFAQHCEACPYCGKALFFIDESQFVYCGNCRKNIRVSNGTLIG